MRFYSPIETIGGGQILDPKPHKHKQGDMEVPVVLDMLQKGDDKTQVEALLRENSSRYVPLSQLRLQTNLNEEAFAACIQALEEEGKLVTVTDKLKLHEAYYHALGQKAQGILSAFHKENPLKAGMRRETLRAALFPRLEPGAGDKLLERMAADGILAVAGRCLALPGFQVSFTPEQEALKERLYQACAQEPFAPPERSGLIKEMGRAKDFQKVLDYLTDEGELVPLEPDLLFTRKAVEEAEAIFRQLAEAEGTVTLAQFRDGIGTSRKYAMALLEYWDVTGLTKKEGDARRLRR